MEQFVPFTAPASGLRALGFDELAQAAAPIRWIWHGYLAAGKLTLLTSQWKSGKTTLLSFLLDRLKAGGDLLGQTVTPGKALVISEEPADLWASRAQGLDFRGHVQFLCQPFVGRPTTGDWLGLLEYVCDLRTREGIDLAVFDTLAPLLPCSENSATSVIGAMGPLQRACRAGLAVWGLHHPRKGITLAGQAARGSGALTAAADIVLEMAHFHTASSDDRRRLLRAFSRFSQTPSRLVIQLNPEGTEYVSLGTQDEVEFNDMWDVLQTILEQADEKWTRTQIREHWPAEHPTPAEATLWRWLNQAHQQGQLRRDGLGRACNPFRYWLPAREEALNRDPQTPQQMEVDKELADWFESLGLIPPQ